jgi:hypothetical protein
LACYANGLTGTVAATNDHRRTGYSWRARGCGAKPTPPSLRRPAVLVILKCTAGRAKAVLKTKRGESKNKDREQNTIDAEQLPASGLEPT